jgi:hypothetical protein
MPRQIFAPEARPLLLAAAAAALLFPGAGCFSGGQNLVEEDRQLTALAASAGEAETAALADAAPMMDKAPDAEPMMDKAPDAGTVRKLPMPAGQRQADGGGEPTTRPSELEAAPMRVFVLQGEDVALGENAVPSPPEGLSLPAGLYRFRLVNKSVRPKYFWLRHVARGGDSPDGETVIVQLVPEENAKDNPVLLEPGDYYYSAPMPIEAERFRLTVR